MLIRWLLAAIHLRAFGLALAAIATRNRAFKRVAAAASVQVADCAPCSAPIPAGG
ncbi:MAG: hypothetical protein GAK41_00275 [Burkholderia gladioli]|nr:MAG: hypothetical protein GAK41_00275 [Burkholderia gladioli]